LANVHILQQINWKGLSEISIRRAFFTNAIGKFTDYAMMKSV